MFLNCFNYGWPSNGLNYTCYEGTPMRHRKTACFQALVLDPRSAQMSRPLLATFLFPWLAEVRCKYLNVAAHVLVKPMFASSDAANAPAVCRYLAVASFQCFTRSNINCNRGSYIRRNQVFLSVWRLKNCIMVRRGSIGLRSGSYFKSE